MATLFFWLKLAFSNIASVLLLSAIIFGNWSDPSEYVLVGIAFFLYGVAFGFYLLEKRTRARGRRMFESAGELREPARVWRRPWHAYVALFFMCPGSLAIASMIGSRYAQLTLLAVAVSTCAVLTYRICTLAFHRRLLAERLDIDRVNGGFGEWYLFGYPYLLFWSTTLVFQCIYMLWGSDAFKGVPSPHYIKDWGWYSLGLAINVVSRDALEFVGGQTSPIEHVKGHWVAVLVWSFKGMTVGALLLLARTSYRLVANPPRVVHLPKN